MHRRLFAILALAGVYLLTARLGLALDAVAGFATLVWAPTGIALAALFRGGRRLWPGVLLGAFAVNVWVGASPLVAAGIATGNTLEAILGAWLLVRLGLDLRLERVSDVAVLIAVALGSTTLSATLGVASLLAGGAVRTAEWAHTWRAWWVGDVIGDVIVAPLLLVWSVAPRAVIGWKRLVEGASLCVASIATSVAVFGPSRVLGAHVLFAPLIWGAVRFRQRGSTLTVLIVSACAVAGTVLAHGPFVHPQLSRSLLDLQSFMGFVAAVTLLLGAAIADRDQAKRTAVAALRGRDDFLAIASHELRTPISSLTLQVGTMRRLLARGEKIADERLERAERQSDRVAQLVTRLLDVSRIEAGQLRIQPEPLDLDALVRDVGDRMADEASRAGCGLHVATCGSLMGSWDRLRLEQVLSNLLSNAFRHAAGHPVDVLLERSDGRARLAVRDHGPGLPGGDVEAIFGPYRRGDASRERGGLGLGLYISRRLVEVHGGSLTARNVRDGGSEFIVELPLVSRYPGRDGRWA